MESDSSEEGGENRLEEEKCVNTMSIVCKIIRFRSLSSNSGNNSWENRWLDQSHVKYLDPLIRYKMKTMLRKHIIISMRW